MTREEKIEKILDDLIKSGSNINYLNDLKREAMIIAKKDYSLKEAMEVIAAGIEIDTHEFLNNKNSYGVNYINGISTCIYLSSYDNGEYKFKALGGNISRTRNLPINENTMFDIASITKLYLLVLLFKLEQYGMINLDDKIADINPDFKGLEDFTFNDLIRLHGELRTNGNIATAKSKEESYDILKTLYLESNSREENKYSDFGAIIISDTLEKMFSKYGRSISFNEILNRYLLSPMGLNRTTFNPETSNISGNERNDWQVHDPKVRALGGVAGSAGLFASSDDIARFAKELFSLKYINKEHVERLGEITFPNSKQSNKGNLGVYVKHPLGFEKTFTPSEFSTGSFSHQGWTGSLATFDPNNMIHQNILVDAIYNTEDKNLVKNDKPIGYGDAFDEYLKNITKNTMLMYVAKEYYNRYCNVKEDTSEKVYVR